MTARTESSLQSGHSGCLPKTPWATVWAAVFPLDPVQVSESAQVPASSSEAATTWWALFLKACRPGEDLCYLENDGSATRLQVACIRGSSGRGCFVPGSRLKKVVSGLSRSPASMSAFPEVTADDSLPPCSMALRESSCRSQGPRAVISA